MTWQRCPLCGGRGTVSPGFYSGSPVTTGTSTEREECRSCHGKGVLLDPIGTQAPYVIQNYPPPSLPPGRTTGPRYHFTAQTNGLGLYA